MSRIPYNLLKLHSEYTIKDLIRESELSDSHVRKILAELKNEKNAFAESVPKKGAGASVANKCIPIDFLSLMRWDGRK